MNDYYLLFFIAGIIVGWLTKIPFFLKFYRDFEREKLELWQANKRILELIKKGEL